MAADSDRTSGHGEHSALRRRVALAGTGALVLGGVTPISALLVTDSADAVNGSVVTNTTDDVDNPAGGSLRDVIDNSAPGDVITFDLLPESTITLKDSIVIDKPLTIRGPGRDTLTIDGGGEDDGGFTMFVVDVDEDPIETVVITGVTVANGSAADEEFGGAVACRDQENVSLVIDEVTFTDNTADVGGAISWLECGDVTITGSMFSENTATRSASAVYVAGGSYDDDGSVGPGFEYSGTLAIESTLFQDNLVVDDDPDGPGTEGDLVGALAAVGLSEISITDSGFIDNGLETVQGLYPLGSFAAGGGASLIAQTVEVTESSFVGNISKIGGALAVYGGEVTISGSEFSENCGVITGGAVWTYGVSQLDIDGSEFTDNQAVILGGAIGVGYPYFLYAGGAVDGLERNTTVSGLGRGGRLSGRDSGPEIAGELRNGETLGAVVITGSTLEGNQAEYFGGAISLAERVDLTISESILTENQAMLGGAIATPFPFLGYSGGLQTAVNGDGGDDGDDAGGACSGPLGPGPLAEMLGGGDVSVRDDPDDPDGPGSITAGRVTIEASTVSQNASRGLGTAIVVADDVLVTGSTFSSNESSALVALGSEMFGSPGDLGGRFQVVDSVFADNGFGDESGYTGGLISFGFSVSEITGSTFSGNTSFYGGTVSVLSSTGGALISNSTFSDNQAPEAALVLDTLGSAIVMSTITGTTAVDGSAASGIRLGGLYSYDPDNGGDDDDFNGFGVLSNLGLGDDNGDRDPVGLGVIGSVISANGAGDVADISVITDDDIDYELVIESSVVGSVMFDEVPVPVGQFGSGNVATDDPKLGPLVDNGGPSLPGGFTMLTRLPLGGSPALGLVPESDIERFVIPEELFATDLRFDQRGVGFDRVVDRDGARVSDAGAVTLQGDVPPGPDDGTEFVPLEPARLFDSRAGAGPLEPGVPVAVSLSGVPDDAASVVLNVTVANADGDGFVTVFPCGVPAPPTSNANFVGISTVAGNVISAIGDDGTVCVQLGQVRGDVIVDLMGYFAAGSYLSMVPERVYDSRDGAGVIPAGETVRVRVPEPMTVRGAGAGSGVAAAVVNVTVANAAGDGFFTVWDCASAAPPTSNGNFVGVSTIANNVVTALNDDGELCVRLGQSDANVIVDLMGFVLSDSGYQPLGGEGSSGPQRVFDSRHGTARAARPDADVDDRLVAAGEPVRIALDRLVSDAGAVVVNVTVANATGDGFFTVWDCAGPVPGTSNGNFVGVSTIANNVLVGVDDGAICVQLGQSPAHLIVDVFGSFPEESTNSTRAQR